MIGRYSSRRAGLGRFLPEVLPGALGYDRIAGYFRSSLLEVAGDALEAMAEGASARVVCNSELDPLDVSTARAARDALVRAWRRDLPDDLSLTARRRLERLHRFLSTGRLRVRVLPDERFGFVHGKAGVVTRADRSRVAFIGSTNESRRAWTLNYELLWTDDSPEGVAWVREEFEALWGDPCAVDLADAVIVDIGRVARRTFLTGVPEWRGAPAPEPAAVAVELPVYRRENGLWAHQKSFVEEAFARHRRGGARLLLADQMGLGKTVQLALAAKLMALWGGGACSWSPPRPCWASGATSCGICWSCPRPYGPGAAGRTSRAWPTRPPALRGWRAARAASASSRRGCWYTALTRRGRWRPWSTSAWSWTRRTARRKNLGPAHRRERADPNNLLRFIQEVAPRARSLLLATATPVQLDPIEAWDLLEALNRGDDTVLGSRYSRWVTDPRGGLALVLGWEEPPRALAEAWEWMRDPLPPAEEGGEWAVLRRRLGLSGGETWARPEALARLDPPTRRRAERLAALFFAAHNPYLRHIVRRTREYLESTVDPGTNEPYLRPVRVRLFGEGRDDAVALGGFLADAYAAAEEFCAEVGRRQDQRLGFLKTVLLRRLGSSVAAGRATAARMLGPEGGPGEEDDADDADDADAPRGSLHPMTAAEEDLLRRVLRLLEAATEEDPKYRDVERLLVEGADGTEPWLERGCIVFSQYYESARWVASLLSARLPGEAVALYANAAGSGVYREGLFTPATREAIKRGVRAGAIRLLVGTDAASEGLNLQAIGTLINVDLPWNPTRLEQRKGRIQRIGQLRDEVYIYNMCYRGSVEDRVHSLLSGRLQAIRDLFGQLPDTLEDVWVDVALRDEQKARERIAGVPAAHPFALRYEGERVEPVDWESCDRVLHGRDQLGPLLAGW